MAITKTKAKNRIIVRDCVLCGKPIKITVPPNRRYRGGHYFGKILQGKGIEREYWECNKCCGRVG